MHISSCMRMSSRAWYCETTTTMKYTSMKMVRTMGSADSQACWAAPKSMKSSTVSARPRMMWTISWTTHGRRKHRILWKRGKCEVNNIERKWRSTWVKGSNNRICTKLGQQQNLYQIGPITEFLPNWANNRIFTKLGRICTKLGQ